MYNIYGMADATTTATLSSLASLKSRMVALENKPLNGYCVSDNYTITYITTLWL